MRRRPDLPVTPCHDIEAGRRSLRPSRRVPADPLGENRLPGVGRSACRVPQIVRPQPDHRASRSGESRHTTHLLMNMPKNERIHLTVVVRIQ